MIIDKEVYSPNKISNDFKDLWGSEEKVNMSEILTSSNKILKSYVKLHTKSWTWLVLAYEIGEIPKKWLACTENQELSWQLEQLKTNHSPSSVSTKG